MGNYNGSLSAAQILQMFDPLSAILEGQYSNLGLALKGQAESPAEWQLSMATQRVTVHRSTPAQMPATHVSLTV